MNFNNININHWISYIKIKVDTNHVTIFFFFFFKIYGIIKLIIYAILQIKIYSIYNKHIRLKSFS